MLPEGGTAARPQRQELLGRAAREHEALQPLDVCLQRMLRRELHDTKRHLAPVDGRTEGQVQLILTRLLGSPWPSDEQWHTADGKRFEESS